MPTQPSIDLQTTVVRSQDQLSGDIDHQIVLLSIEKGEYYQLDGAGSRIWELIDAPRTVSELVNRILEEFDIDRAACERQVLDFLRQLQTEGLIVAEP